MLDVVCFKNPCRVAYYGAIIRDVFDNNTASTNGDIVSYGYRTYDACMTSYRDIVTNDRTLATC